MLLKKDKTIDIYNAGFKGNCDLNRVREGKKLSDLVERIQQPMVIALDAPWGAGKTFFLKCWVGAHTLENQGTAQTVYFDAFKYDFLDDPLVALTAAVSERLSPDRDPTSKVKQLWGHLASIAKPGLRIGLAVASAGASEYLQSMGDAAIEATRSEVQDSIDALWQKEESRRAAMNDFRRSLEDLASERKLVIVVDELDRCRPDYALNLMEVVKHFFDVENVHFVLGVNLKELANSVRARYGTGIQAERYLQKFISVVMPLGGRQGKSAQNAHTLTALLHFEKVSSEVGLDNTWMYHRLRDIIQGIDYQAKVSLRDVEKIITLAMVTPDPTRDTFATRNLYLGCLVLQVLNPFAIEQARKGQLSQETLYSTFDREYGSQEGSDLYDFYVAWRSALDTREGSILSRSELLRSNQMFQSTSARKLLRETIAETLDAFEISG